MEFRVGADRVYDWNILQVGVAYPVARKGVAHGTVVAEGG